MKKTTSKPIDFGTRARWRAWLAAHHDSAREVWLIFHKRGTGRPSIEYEDAVEEALCFGWIDSLLKRIDDERYMRKFTPRKESSRWSSVNRERYERLRERGALTPAGLQRPPTATSGDAPRPSLTNIPSYIREALSRNPAAKVRFEQLPPSHRRAYLGWIDSAKRMETKEKRLREAIDIIAAGKKLGLK